MEQSARCRNRAYVYQVKIPSDVSEVADLVEVHYGCQLKVTDKTRKTIHGCEYPHLHMAYDALNPGPTGTRERGSNMDTT